MAELYKRIVDWLINGAVGLSSQQIVEAMIDMPLTDPHGCHPHDPDDFNRCLLLLENFPEWRPRLGEMKVVSPEWAILADHWDELEAMFLDEDGRERCKADNAPRTYDRMEELIRQAEGD